MSLRARWRAYHRIAFGSLGMLLAASLVAARSLRVWGRWGVLRILLLCPGPGVVAKLVGCGLRREHASSNLSSAWLMLVVLWVVVPPNIMLLLPLLAILLDHVASNWGCPEAIVTQRCTHLFTPRSVSDDRAAFIRGTEPSSHHTAPLGCVWMYSES